jgi:adenylate cyclase class 2
MSNEIELKVAVGDHRAIGQTLLAAGAEYLCSFVETDRFFDTPDRRMRQADSAIRLRTLAPLGNGRDQADTRALLTHKGPRQPSAGGLKVRPEYQTRLDDPEAMVRVLQAAGLMPTLTIQKRRTSYRLDGCQVELDELPHLGCFVEIEGPDEQAVCAVRDRLGLTSPSITKSYLALLDAHCGGLPEGAEVTFESA